MPEASTAPLPSSSPSTVAKHSTGYESLARLDARIAALDNPKHKAWLTTHRNHWWGEVIGDVDAVMRTMSHKEITYSFDGHPFMTADMSWVKTHADTRDMYEGVVALGVPMAGPTDDERVYFSDTGLVFTCILTVVYPGAFFPTMPGIKAEGMYLARWPNITIVDYDEHNLMLGERIYNGAPLVFEPTDASMIKQLVGSPAEDDPRRLKVLPPLAF